MISMTSAVLRVAIHRLILSCIVILIAIVLSIARADFLWVITYNHRIGRKAVVW